MLLKDSKLVHADIAITLISKCESRVGKRNTEGVLGPESEVKGVVKVLKVSHDIKW